MGGFQTDLFRDKSAVMNFRYDSSRKDELTRLYKDSLPRLMRSLADDLLAEGLLKEKKENEIREIKKP